MNKHHPHGQRKLISLVSLLSMLFIASASFEKGSQDCRVINAAKRKEPSSYLLPEG